MQRFAKSHLFPVFAFPVFIYWLWRCWLVQGPDRSDLKILLVGAERLSRGLSPYQLSDWAEQTKPPLINFVFQLFLNIPPNGMIAFWDLLSWASLMAILFYWVGARRGASNQRIFMWTCGIGCWWAEMRLGQYNFPLVASALLLPLWVREQPNLLRLMVLGAGMVGLTLMKPTSLLFMPWMLSGVAAQPRNFWAVSVGALMSLAFPIAFYGAQFGVPAIWAAHQEWFHFLPLSEAKHLLRSDNLGFPTYFARLGVFSFPSAVFLLGGLLAGLWASVVLPLHRWSFTLSVFFSVVCSPMAWRQNFGPLYVLLAGLWVVNLSRMKMYVNLLLALLVGAFQLAGSDLLGNAGFESFNRSGVALLLVIAFSVGVLAYAFPGQILLRDGCGR